MRKYIQHWWDLKDTPRVELNKHVLVFKTKFNNAWNYFNINQLYDTMMQPIWTTLSKWRRGIIIMPTPLHQVDVFITDPDLSDRNIQHFFKEFSGNLWTDLDESLVVSLDPWKAPC